MFFKQIYFVIEKQLFFFKIGNNGKLTKTTPTKKTTTTATKISATKATLTTTMATPIPSWPTQSSPRLSCKSIKEQFGNLASSELYWIDLQPATQVYCDMDSDGCL